MVRTKAQPHFMMNRQGARVDVAVVETSKCELPGLIKFMEGVIVHMSMSISGCKISICTIDYDIL